MRGSVASVMRKHVSELFQILMQYGATDRESFVDMAETDRVFQKAALMCVGYIGELSKKMDDGFKVEHPEVNWRRLGTSRNIIFHEYDIVDIEIISTVVFKDIAALQALFDQRND